MKPGANRAHAIQGSRYQARALVIYRYVSFLAANLLFEHFLLSH
jgi:hypothetical protein